MINKQVTFNEANFKNIISANDGTVTITDHNYRRVGKEITLQMYVRLTDARETHTSIFPSVKMTEHLPTTIIHILSQPFVTIYKYSEYTEIVFVQLPYEIL